MSSAKADTGRVVSLDRGYPLVQVRTQKAGEKVGEKAAEFRAQHAALLIKNSDLRAVVGDLVELASEPGQDMPYITAIAKRSSILAREELVESIHEGAGKTKRQVLAANFDLVLVVQSLGKRPLDVDYLERQLVMAHQSGVAVAVLLTKADQAPHLAADLSAAKACAPASQVLALNSKDPSQIPALRKLLGASLVVLLGRSGVGKSTLVNALVGEERQATGSVRNSDRAGRHTTVARRLVPLPDGGAIIDTPGMRTIGILGAADGLAGTFPEIEEAGKQCHYRNCTHTHEPHCAVQKAVAAGSIEARRLSSYRLLTQEVFD